MKTVDYPPLFATADAASQVAQRRHKLLVQVDLLLVVAAAVFAAAQTFVPKGSGSWVAAASAVLLLAALLAQTVLTMLKLERNWYGGRAVAESVKTAAWRYMTRVEPFNVANEAADRELVGVLQETLDDRRDLDLGGSKPGGEQITPYMRHVRSLALPERKRWYVQERIVDQISYYAPRAQRNSRSAALWFRIGLVARAAALGFAVLSVVKPSMTNVVALFSAVVASVTAWGELGRHDELATSYSVAAQELTRLKDLAENAEDEQRFENCVIDAEGAISREHTMWTVKRS